MASSKIMPSSNSDLNPYSSTSSIYSPLPGPAAAATPTMDDLLRTIYPTNPSAQIIPHDSDGIKLKTVDEVWKEISDRKMAIGGPGDAGVGFEEMTLEDFLAKEGAVREEDVRVPSVSRQFGVNLGNNGYQPPPPPQQIDNSNLGFLSGSEGGGATVGRGKRRIVQEPVVDRAAQQRQRRMIKNRESAARSRERKQAYTVELESLVTRLEEENAQLVKQERERNRKRLRELMETLIPVDEKRRPPRLLRRTRSIEW